MNFRIFLTLAVVLWLSSSLWAQGVDLQEARRSVLNAASQQVNALESIIHQVPGEAQGKLAEAIAASSGGRNRALGALDNAERGSISAEVGVARALRAVDEGTKIHLEVLSDLIEQVPDEAKPAIYRAYRESQTGRNTALSALSAIKRGEVPPIPESVGRGETYGAPERSRIPKRSEISEIPRRPGSPLDNAPGGFRGLPRPSSPGGIGGGFPGGGFPGGIPGGIPAGR